VDAYDLDQHEEDLTLLIHAWPDIEEALLEAAANRGAYDEEEREELADAIRQAFRVEVQSRVGVWDVELGYVLLFDVNSYKARQAATVVNDRRHRIDSLARSRAPLQGFARSAEVRVVPSGKPVGGEVCPRVMAAPPNVADLQDLPEPEPPNTAVPLVSRGLHKLTPIEAPFYDALQEAGLVFAVQPRVQGERTYRPDFIVFYGGQAAVVEIDGHEGHKSKDQRNHDTARQNWFERMGLRVHRWTGSQVYANAAACVQQLLEILRGSGGRP
jgi:very-short-patch-repair endonuclease